MGWVDGRRTEDGWTDERTDGWKVKMPYEQIHRLTDITENRSRFQLLQELLDPGPRAISGIRDVDGDLLVNVVHVRLLDGYRAGLAVAPEADEEEEE